MPVDKLKRREMFIKLFLACECVLVRGGDAERKSSPEAGCVIKGNGLPGGRLEYLSEVTDKGNKRVSGKFGAIVRTPIHM